MKNCININNSLPLYSEGLLSAAENMVIEEHLVECADCSKELANLKKAATMTRELSEVEPPPWFNQKIIAKVREESERKSFAQKWFYPLRIKIPVQVMATVVIAVLAVYIYRAGDEQMKTVLPEVQQPVMEAQKEPTPAETDKTKAVATDLLAVKKAASVEAAKKDTISEDVFFGGSAPKMEMQENKPAGASDKSSAMKSYAAADKEEKKYSERAAMQEVPQRYSARQGGISENGMDDSSLSGAAKKSKMFKAAAPAAPRSIAASVTAQVQPVISLYVADINNAVVEAEKIMTKYKARKVTKRLMDGKAILQADLPTMNIKDVLSQLRTLGILHEKTMPTESGEQHITVVLEIFSQ